MPCCVCDFKGMTTALLSVGGISVVLMLISAVSSAVVEGQDTLIDALGSLAGVAQLVTFALLLWLMIKFRARLGSRFCCMVVTYVALLFIVVFPFDLLPIGIHVLRTVRLFRLVSLVLYGVLLGMVIHVRCTVQPEPGEMYALIGGSTGSSGSLSPTMVEVGAGEPISTGASAQRHQELTRMAYN